MKIDSLMFACEPEYLKANFTSFFILALKPLELSDVLSIKDNIATLRIEGSLDDSKYDLYLKALSQVQSDSSINQLDLMINSPGGIVGKVDSVWQKVKDLSESIRVVAYNIGVMASAAYWIGSAANQIIAVNPTAETGSIGIVYATYDLSKMREKEGVTKIEIISSSASNKNADITTDKGKQLIQERIDAIESVFISRIAEGRKVSKDTVINKYGQGKVLMAKDPRDNVEDALSQGLIDQVIGRGFNINTQSQMSISADNRYSVGEGFLNIITTEGNEQSNVKLDTLEQCKGVRQMKTLEEYLAEDSKLERLVNKAIEAARAEAVKERIEQQKQVTVLLRGQYPDSVKELIIGSLEGTKSFDAVTGAVAAFDGFKAEQAITEAQVELEDISSTPIVSESSVTADGVIKDFDGLKVASEQVKNRLKGVI